LQLVSKKYLLKRNEFKNSFIHICRKFLDRFWQKQRLRPAKIQGQHWPRVLQKQSPPRFSLRRGGENICGVVFFLQKRCFCQTLFQGRVATIRTNEAYADFKHLLNN